MSSAKSQATRYGLAAVCLWATAATAFKLALASSTPCMVVLMSSSVSLLVIAAMALHARRRLTVPLLVNALPRGVLNPFIYYLVLLEAYDRLPAQVAMVVNYLWPIMLVLLHAAMSRTRLRGASLLATGVSFGGVALLALLHPGGMRELDLAGLLLALVSTLIWAGYWLLNLERGRGGGGQDVVTLLAGFIWGVPLLFSYALLTGGLEIPDAGAVLASAWIGLFEMGITYVVWLKALSLAREPSEVGNLVYLTPFLSLGFIALVLREPLRIPTLCGLVLVLAGIVIQRRFGTDSDRS